MVPSTEEAPVEPVMVVELFVLYDSVEGVREGELPAHKDVGL